MAMMEVRVASFFRSTYAATCCSTPLGSRGRRQRRYPEAVLAVVVVAPTEVVVVPVQAAIMVVIAAEMAGNSGVDDGGGAYGAVTLSLRLIQQRRWRKLKWQRRRRLGRKQR